MSCGLLVGLVISSVPSLRQRNFRQRMDGLQSTPSTVSCNESSRGDCVVHPSIARILSCSDFADLDNKAPVSQRRLQVHDNLTISWSTTTTREIPSHLEANDLVPLALECDTVLFQNDSFSIAEACRRGDDMPQHQQQVLHSLMRLPVKGASPHNTLATLVALNALETTLCRLVLFPADGTKGRRRSSPLLTTVLTRLQETTDPTVEQLLPVLNCLLLPTGLNLRNLLWHGFVGRLERAWFSLVWILLHQLDRSVFEENGLADEDWKQREKDKETALPPLHPVLQKLVATRGGRLRRTFPESSSFHIAIRAWLPTDDHVALFDFATELLEETTASSTGDTVLLYPTFVSILLITLLESGLRQAWCRANDRPDQTMAQPCVMYVTLDGHGQQRQHDLLLCPYLLPRDEPSTAEPDRGARNKLIHELGGPSVALLTDLFVSPTGPNLRAAAAHGSWSELIAVELQRWSNSKSDFRDKSQRISCESPHSRSTNELVDILLIALECASSNERSLDHTPIYSYTATTISSLHCLQEKIHDLNRLRAQCLVVVKSAADLSSPLEADRSLSLPPSLVESRMDHLLSVLRADLGASKSSWTAEHVFLELETNRKLADVGATRRLVNDVEMAVEALLSILEQGFKEHGRCTLADSLPDETPLRGGSRSRKRWHRLLACCLYAAEFYGFAAFVAVLNLEDSLSVRTALGEVSAEERRSLLLKAAERTRMVASTVSTFLVKNADRSLKAIADYAKGKAVKKILADLEATSSCE